MTTVDPGEARDRLPFGQHHAFLIGIDAYAKVSRLKTAVEDARQVAEVLRTQQHFLVHPLLLDATGGDIRTLLHTTLREQVREDDRVFFYFAGHGIAGADDGEAGYLVPADADPADISTLIPMADLQRALNALPCRHLLLILDCCFSGAFKWSSRYRDVGALMPKKIYQERFDRFIHDRAWQVITSAAYDQKALDVIDGKVTGARGLAASSDDTPHSPFAKALFEGLAGAADARGDGEGDGVITATELYSYIRDQVEPETITAGERLRQTPGFFPLAKHDKGEFIFLHPRHRLNLPRLPDRNPYQGLASFDQDDQLLFYGRDRVTAELLAKAESHKLLVITGASGTGKSSVARAGLLPKLKSAGCRILTPIRPGEHPLVALEQALTEARAADPVGGATEPPGTLKSVLLGTHKTVLLIDQFEELITRCADDHERHQFEAELHRLLTSEADAPDALIHRIVVTVRADFEPQFSGGVLATEWMAGRSTVPPFSLEELKEVIVLPTLQEVLIFEPAELVDQIVEDVVQAPGALPLLSYALSELYDGYRTSGRQDRALTKADYDRTGGVMGALGKKADALYRSLDASTRDLVRKILLRMVSAEGDLASRRVPMDDLVYTDAATPLVDTVIETLVAARLIVRAEDYVEPAHDALVRQWSTLQEWIHTVGEDKLILGARLSAAANELAQSQDDGLLWNDRPDLPLLEEERHHPHRWFNAKEESFIDRSVARRRQLLQEREERLQEIARQQEEIAQQQTEIADQQGARARLQRRAAWALSVAAVILLGLLGWVVVQTRALSVGNSGLLASAAEAAADAGLIDRSLRLGVLAARSPWPGWLHPTDATAAPVVSLAASRIKLLALFTTDAAIVSASFSPDGAQVLIAAGDLVRLNDVATGRRLLEVRHDGIAQASLIANGTRILTQGEGTVRLWETATGHPVGEAMEHNQDSPGFASVSADGARLVTASGKSARVWETTTGKKLIELQHGDAVESASVSHDGTRVVTAAGTTVTVWDAATGVRLRLLKHAAVVGAASFSPDGTRVLTRAFDTARLWDAATGKLLHTLRHSEDIDDAGMSPDGRRVIAVGGTASLWDAFTGKLVRELTSEGGIWTSADFSADSRRIITRSNQSFLWNALDGSAVGDLTGELINAAEVSESGQASDFSPDGARVITAAGKTVRIWDAASGKRLDEWRQDAEIAFAGFSADGMRAITTAADREVRVWDANTGPHSLVSELGRPGESEAPSPVVSPDGTRVLTAAGQTAYLWDAASGKQTGELTHDADVESVGFSADGTRVITAAGWSVHLWDTASARQTGELKHDDAVIAASFSPDGRRVITAAGTAARIWDTATGSQTGELKHDDLLEAASFVVVASFSPDGTRVITAAGTSAHLWDVATGKHVSELKHEDIVEYPDPVGDAFRQQRAASFSPDGSRILTAGLVTARLWDATGHDLGVNEADVVDAGFSPDSKRLITRSGRSELARDGTRVTTDGGPARLWNAMTGRHVADLTNAGPVRSTSFSPDGSRVVTAGGTARLWDSATGTQVGEIKNDETIDFARFSPDGRRLVTWAEFSYNTARIWDAQTGKPLGELVHDANIFLARFGLDGTRVITHSYANGVRLWDASWPALARDAGLVSAVCQRALLAEARRITEADVRASKVLTVQRVGEDVCEGVAPAGAR